MSSLELMPCIGSIKTYDLEPGLRNVSTFLVNKKSTVVNHDAFLFTKNAEKGT